MNRLTFLKGVFIALCLFFSGAIIFASGSGQQGPATPASKPTLQIGIQTNSWVLDYKDNYLTRYLENLHDINLEFYNLPADGGESRTRISLLAVSNALPETLWGGGMTGAQILEYGSNGALIALNRYFNDPSKTPYFNRIPQDTRNSMLRDTRSADTNNYAFPQFQPETWNQTPYRLYINRSWLSRLGLQEPKSTDDLRNVLIAFRDRDPNGNGRRDEIGVFGWFNGGYGENVIIALINAFLYYNSGSLALDATGNTVIAPAVDPAFRRALQYLNGLFRDGLLDASIFTVDQQTFRSVLNAVPMVVGLTSMGSVGNFPGNPTTDDNANYMAMAPIMPPLSSPNSPGYTPYSEYGSPSTTFITNKARNVDLAVKVMDSFYEPTLSIITRFGEENVDWTRDPATLARHSNAYVYLGLYPGLTLLQLRDVWTMQHSKHWQNVTPRYAPLDIGNTFGSALNPFDPNRPSTLHNAVNYQYLIPRHPQYLLPSLIYTAAEAPTLGGITTTINTYVNQSIAEFVTSARDINNDAVWNAYLRELDNMGLQNWLRLAQTAFNRQR